MLIHLDHEQRKARLLLKAPPILEKLMEEEAANPKYACSSFIVIGRTFEGFNGCHYLSLSGITHD